MRRWLTSVAVLLVGTGVFLVCRNDAFVTPAKSKKNASSGTTIAPKLARHISLVLPEDTNDDLFAMEAVARLEIGENQAIYTLFQPKPGDPPTKQAELIREAAKLAPSAIIVVPNKSKETAEALASVDQNKSPIVLLGRAPAAIPGGSAPLVTLPDFGPTAKQIVATLLEEAKRTSQPDDAPVLLLKIEPADETSAARDAALTAAIKATSHPIAAVVSVVDDSVSRISLTNALKAHPKVCAVICDDSMGVSVASGVRTELKPKNVFQVGGYCTSPKTVSLSTMNQSLILVDRGRENMVRKAIAIAFDRIEGRTVAPRTEIELSVRRNQASQPAPALPAPEVVPTTIQDLLPRPPG